MFLTTVKIKLLECTEITHRNCQFTMLIPNQQTDNLKFKLNPITT